MICPGSAENDHYLCEALPESKWVTAEGLIYVTFNKYRWAHIDNNTDEAFDLGVGMEIGTLKQVDQELSVKELNQLTAEPVHVEVDELDVCSESAIPKLMIPERRTKLKEILKIEHPELTKKQCEVALELLLKNNGCFSLDLGELGTMKGIEVEIDTGDVRPIRQAPRRIAMPFVMK